MNIIRNNLTDGNYVKVNVLKRSKLDSKLLCSLNEHLIRLNSLLRKIFLLKINLLLNYYFKDDNLYFEVILNCINVSLYFLSSCKYYNENLLPFAW